MKPRTLVTGGAGCIGSELCEALLDRGHQVVALDNLSSGRIEHIAPLMGRAGFRFVEGDLLNPACLDDALAGVGMVHHLAANPDVQFSTDNPDRDLRQNTLATFQLLEAMRRHGVRKLAFASSSAVYGPCTRFPIPEDAPGRPISLYGATKLACEAMVGAYQHLFEMQCWVFRFSNIVGQKVRKRGGTVISDFIAKLQDNPRRLEILGDGRQAKSYLLSKECVSAMLFAIEHARDPFNLYNLGCNDWLTVRRIAELVVQTMRLADVEFVFSGTAAGWPGDVPRFLLDVRALAGLGWTARYNSEQAVSIAIASVLNGSPACKP